MKHLFFVLLFSFSFSAFSKEWKNMQQFEIETSAYELPASDWFKSDRISNTLTWKRANTHNLQNNSPEEYQTIKQRRDFYQWYYQEIQKKGHEVVWPKMAHFISNKLRLIKVFPYAIFTKKSVKNYASKGSKTVFNNAFADMKSLYFSTTILKGREALIWDETVLHKEQREWIEPIYKSIDIETLKIIERMAKGKGFYGLMVANKIRFQGDITNKTTRYSYALNSLREYCEKRYK